MNKQKPLFLTFMQNDRGGRSSTGLTLSLVEGRPPGTQGHARIAALLLQNTMDPAWSLAGILQPGGGLECVPGLRVPGESGPQPTPVEAELTARVCLDQIGLRKWSLATTCPHLAVPLGQGRTRHFSTGDQLTQGG